MRDGVSGGKGVTTIVRHADAGARSAFDGPDAERPLSRRGRAQAAALATVLGPRPISAILSSPARRCVETVAPLAGTSGHPVEIVDALDESSTGAAALAVLVARASANGGVLVASTHGPIFEDLLALRSIGERVGGIVSIPKAGRLELVFDGDQIVEAAVHPAPAR
jgi:8-oxo-dGTP diphosphatase